MQTQSGVLSAVGVFFASLSVFYAAPASAQVSQLRNWVSSAGDDANASIGCNRATPCRTFAQAVALTIPEGEINCVDAGSYGSLTIDRSITIDCTGTLGAVLASGSFGIRINTPGVKVVLRGISISGVTGAHNGIRFLQGASLTIIDSLITNFTSASGGNAIAFDPSTTAELHIVNTVLAKNRRGILVSPTGNGSANVTLDRVTVNDNVEGLRVLTTNSAGPGAFVVATGSTFSGNGTGMALVTPAGTNFAVAKLVNSTISSNTGVGLLADGPTVRADVAGSTITNNGTGVSATNGAILLSYGDNLVDRNFVDGAFTGPVSKR